MLRPTTGGDDAARQRFHLRWWIEPVRRDTNCQCLGTYAGKGGGIAPSIFPTSGIVSVHCVGEIQVGIGIESSAQLFALVMEVGLDVQPCAKERPGAPSGGRASDESCFQPFGAG